jgi:SulP family sulfate permease
MAGIVAVSNTITYGVLIFSGAVPEKVSAGIGLALFSGLLLSLIIVFFGKANGLIAFPQSAIAPILALMALHTAQDMARYPAETIFLTIVGALMVSSFIVGIVVFIFGRFDFGDLIRFMPYPVVGGFLAGLGWLLVEGSIKVSLIGNFSLLELFQPENLIYWTPAIAFGLLILFAERITKNYLVIPGMLIGGVVIFYLLVFILGSSPGQMMTDGWLLGPFPEGDLWQPYSMQAISGANWAIIPHQAGTMLTLILTSLIGSLLNFSGIELATKQDIDLNQELQASGLANMFVGLSGGMIGYPSASISILANRVGARGRGAGIFTSVLFAVVLLFGTELIAYIPKPVVAGMLVYVGMGFLIRWVVEARKTLPYTDYFVLLFILAIIIGAGLLPGVAVGSIIMVILFVVNYSQIKVVRNELTGVNYHSNVQRSPYHQRILLNNGEKILFLKLQGFIFFGTAFSLLTTVKERAEDQNLPSLTFVVLDFRLINGVDSSAMSSFTQMVRLAKKHEFTMVFSDVSDDLMSRIKLGLDDESESAIQIFDDIDRSAEWCEERILDIEEATAVGAVRLANQLHPIFKNAERVEKFISYLEKEEIPAGYTLINQDDPPTGIYFIERGKVTAQLALDDGKFLRLRTMGSGTIVGELSIYLGMHATAIVVTEEPSIVYSLMIKNLIKLEEEEPNLAADFHKFMAGFLGERVVDMNQTVQALLD